jgi:hypothetical protein
VRNDCLEAALRELAAAGIRDVAQSRGGKHILQPACHAERHSRITQHTRGHSANSARRRRAHDAGTKTPAQTGRSRHGIGATRCRPGADGS